MRIGIYDNDCGLIEIKEIHYNHYSRKDTMVYYDYYYESKMVLFEGWLSLDQIVEKLIEIVMERDVQEELKEAEDDFAQEDFIKVLDRMQELEGNNEKKF